MTKPPKLWTQSRWAAVATYVESIGETLEEAITAVRNGDRRTLRRIIREDRKWDTYYNKPNEPDEPSSSWHPYIDEYELEFKKCIAAIKQIIPSLTDKAKVEDCIAAMEHAISQIDDVPEVPTGETLIRDEDGTPIAWRHPPEGEGVQ